MQPTGRSAQQYVTRMRGRLIVLSLCAVTGIVSHKTHGLVPSW